MNNMLVKTLKEVELPSGIIVSLSEAKGQLGESGVVSILISGNMRNSSEKSVFIKRLNSSYMAVDNVLLSDKDGSRVKGSVLFLMGADIDQEYQLLPGINDKNRGPTGKVYFSEDLTVGISQDDIEGWKRMRKAEKLILRFNLAIRFRYHVMGTNSIERATANMPVEVEVIAEKRRRNE